MEPGLSTWVALLIAASGGIFGVAVTLTVTWWRDKAEKAEEQKRKLRWLLAEIIDNIGHVDHYSLAGGRAKAKLLTQAWEAVKGDTADLDPDTTKALRTTYAEVWRFNGIVEYDLVKIPPGSGLLDSSLAVKAGEVKSALAASYEKLAKHLGVSQAEAGESG